MASVYDFRHRHTTFLIKPTLSRICTLHAFLTAFFKISWMKFPGVWENSSEFHLTISFNPFSTNVPLLYSLKAPENRRLSYVFRGYRSGKLVENGLKYQKVQFLKKQAKELSLIRTCRICLHFQYNHLINNLAEICPLICTTFCHGCFYFVWCNFGLTRTATMRNHVLV